MTGRLRAALRDQASNCAALDSPFMERLCILLADRLNPGTPLTDRLFDWPGDLGPRADSVPLRLAGALHALRLQDLAGLVAVYPPHTSDDATLWAAIDHALTQEAAFIDAFINSPPQTNEVRRAATLIAVSHWLTDSYGLPMRVSELGASAGLNLMFDRFALDLGVTQRGRQNPVLTLKPDWTGPPPPATPPRITERRGVDLNPLACDDPRLLAYLWPDQPDRLRLTRAAIAAATAPVDRGDAIDWLEPRLPHQLGQLHLIYSTIAWQYFPQATQDRGRALIQAAGATATADTPLAWFGMEADAAPRGAALTLRLWPGDQRLHMGRADFHGRWLDWTPPGQG